MLHEMLRTRNTPVVSVSPISPYRIVLQRCVSLPNVTPSTSHPLLLAIREYQWCSGKFGTVGTLGSPLPMLSPSFLSPPLPFSPLLSPTFITSPLSGGNNLNDFSENQLTTDFAFLCKTVWGTLLYHRSPLSCYDLGERRSSQNIWGNGVPPRLHHW